jgi:hypothetical protein
MSGSATTYPGVARLYVPETGMHRGFTLLGYTGGPVNSNPQQAWPTAQVMGGKPTDTSRPPDRRNVGLWVTNNSGSPLWVEGLNFQLDFCVPIRLGVDQNPSIDPDDYTVRTNRGTAQTTDVVMIRNCSVLTNNGSGRDVGPGIDMGYCLWTVIEECSLIRPSDIPLDSDRRAAILVRPSEGTSPLTVRKCRAAQGGIRYYAGSSIWHFDVDGFEVESDNEALPPLFEGFSLNSAGYGYLRDLLGADDSTSQPRIRLNHDGSLRPHQVVVHDCGNQVVGPCTNYGGSAGYGGGVIENGGQTLAGLGQFGFASGELTADTLAGRFASPVISNRHYNLWPYHDGSDGISGNVVPQPNGSSTNLIFTSSYWGQAGGNGTLVNSPIADRRGGNTAFQISGLAGDTPEWDWIYAGRPTLQAGDTYLFNFWVRYPNTIPLTGMHTAQLSISQFGSGTAVFERRNLDGNGFLIPKISGNKEWQHYSGYVKLVSFTGTAVFTIQFLAFGSANNPCQFDEVSLIRMPGDQFDQNEIGAQEQNMVGFVQAPAGAGATTQPGQKLLAQGGLGVGNAVAATTPGSVVKKMQLFDGAGNAIGWVPIYSTIT